MTDGDVNPSDVGSQTSSSLLDRARADDRAAWERLVGLYAPLVYGWCRNAGLQPEDARDIGQEVFSAVHRKVADFRHDREGDTFRGWLRTITKNKIKDYFRSRQVASGGSDALQRLHEVPAEEGDTTDGLNPSDETKVLFQQAVRLIRGEFSERDWLAFNSVVVNERSPADVAEELDISVNSVYLAKSRILKRLRGEFQEVIE